MRVQVLGPLELVSDADVHAPLRSPKVRRLLAALVMRSPTVCSTDFLADVLWGEHLPRNPEGALHNLVSRLRRLLDEVDGRGLRLVTKPPGYAMESDREAIDALYFSDLVARASEVAATDPERAATLLDDALALWSGRAYAEFADEPFARAEAARLEGLRAAAIEDRIEIELATGRPADAVARLEPHVARYPLRERPHRQLMVALHRAGRQADALEIYRSYRERLTEELGLEPSPSLAALETAILRRDPSLEGPPTPSATDVTGTAPPPRNEPEPTRDSTDLVGRRELLALIDDRRRRSRLVTLTGPGGVGKTALAREVERRARRQGIGGSCLIELATLSGDADVAGVIMTALGVHRRAGTTTVERLVDALRGASTLLVFDNCEHLVDQVAALVAAVLEACADVEVLATSREPLGLVEEQVIPVLPLPTPVRGDVGLERLAHVPAVDLFVERARAADPTFALTADNAEDVAQLCRRLDGLPLAIELAATRLRSMTPPEIADRLGSGRLFLRNTRRLAEERHRTLQAVVDWSYRLLGPAERQLFEVLSVFASGFTLEAAEAVSDAALPPEARPADVTESIADLVDKSMLSVDHRTGRRTRYRLLDTLRAYGRQQLQERGGQAAARGAHATYHADLTAALATQLAGSTMAGAADEIMEVLDDVRVAHAWALEHDLALACRLVAALFDFAELRLVSEVGDWAEQCLARAAGQEAQLAALPDVAAVAASGARFRGDFDAARTSLDLALRIADDPDDPRRARALYLAGEIAGLSGALADSLSLFEESLRLAPDPASHQSLTARLAHALNRGYLGDTGAALADLARVRDDAARAHDAAVLGWCLYAEGELVQAAEPQRAVDLLQQAIAKSREVGERYLEGVALVTLGSVRGRHGDPQEAIATFREVVEHWRRSGNRTQQWTTVRNVVELLERLGFDEDTGVLLGAVQSRSTGASAYGADADRLTAIEARLGERLGWTRLQLLKAEGAAMADDGVVDAALTALPSPQPAV